MPQNILCTVQYSNISVIGGGSLNPKFNFQIGANVEKTQMKWKKSKFPFQKFPKSKILNSNKEEIPKKLDIAFSYPKVYMLHLLAYETKQLFSKVESGLSIMVYPRFL